MRVRVVVLVAVVLCALGTSPAAADAGCLGDEVGDTQGDFQDARADLVRTCVDWDDALTVLVRAQQMLAPDDPGLEGTLKVITFLGDPEFPEYDLIMTLGPGRLDAEIVRYEYDFEGTSDDFVREVGRCAVPVRLASHYVIGPVDSACTGSDDPLSVTVNTSFSRGRAFVDPTSYDRFPPEYPDTALVDRHLTGEHGRIAGATRIETAALIAQTGFGAARTVYLARADEFADAVAGGSLTDGPVLLVPSCGDVPEAVRQQIERLDPGSVTALGGESAVCESLLGVAASGRGRGRLSGDSRFATAAAIAAAAFPDGADEVYLARADLPVDALAGGVLTKGPVLLVPSCGPVPEVVSRVVSQLSPERAIALGGPGAVCDQVLDDLDPSGSGSRLEGASREGTAVAISRYQFPDGSDIGPVFLARSDQFADAVSAGTLPLAPVLLTPSCDEPAQQLVDEIVRLGPETIVALGGPPAICDFVLHLLAGG